MSPNCAQGFKIVDGILFFFASDPVHGVELWRSDGTEAGTFMVKDIYPGVSDCISYVSMTSPYMTEMNGLLYFAAMDNINGVELWRSDGSEAGTFMVKDFSDSGNGLPEFITNVDGYLYFRARNSDNEPELWKSDGTEAGSVLLKQMWMYSMDAEGNPFIGFNGYVYFSGDEEITAYNFELWRTDGTPAGTELFKILNVEDDEGSDPTEFHILNDKFIFSARPETDDLLFISDGTEAGTVPLVDNTGSSFDVAQYHLPAANTLYFQGDDHSGNRGLWVTDGTNSGTMFLADIESGEFADHFATVVNGNNILYVGYDDNDGCTTIFQSDGTPDGTYQSLDCDVLSTTFEMTTFEDKVILTGSNDDYGQEIWLYEPEFAVAISETGKEVGIELSPNPVNENMNISSSELLVNEQIIISDAAGRVVSISNITGKEISINTTYLLPGIYFIRINNQIQKFIKSN